MERNESGEGAGGLPRRRWLWWVLGGMVILPVLAVLAAALLIPSEAIARAAAERGEAALGAPLAIGDVELDLWPAPSVALRNVRLGDDGDPIATAERLLLRPRILPLLSGQVIVREIVFDRPAVSLRVDSSGALNLPFSSGAERSEGSGGSVSFSVDELRVAGGRLRYRDTRDGTDLRMVGLEQRLRIDGRVESGELARVGLSGRIASDSVDADLPARLAAPLRGVRFAVEHDAELDRSADRLDVARLRLELQRLALEGSGRVEAASDSLRRSVSIELRTDEFSFEDLARSLPEGFLAAMLAGRDSTSGTSAPAQGPELGYAGRVRLSARVEGPITTDSLPRYAGDLSFAEAGVRRGGGDLLSGGQGRISFSQAGVEGQEVTGRLFGEPFTLAFQVTDLAAPVVSFATRGTARVEELAAMAATEEPIEASGALPFDLRGTLRPADPAASVVEGTVGLGGAGLRLSSLLQPVRVEAGTLRFAGPELRLEGIAAAFGESRLRVDGTVAGWLLAALGDSTALPVLSFQARAGTLDLDALLGPSESTYAPLLFARLADRPIDGKSAAEAAREAGLTLPELPRLRAEGSLTAERLVRNGLQFEQVEASFESSPQALNAPRVRFGLMGGVVELGVGLQRGAEDAALIAVFRVEDVGAGSFFDRFTAFTGDLSGLLSMQGEASLTLDRDLLPVRPTVQSRGSVALTGGSLSNWPLVKAAGDRLGLQRFDTLAFREWSGRYQVAGPLVSIERSVQLGEAMETELAGSFDFGGKLDLGVVTTLSAGLVAGAAEPIQAAARMVAGESGSVPVGIRIGGTTAAPTIALDLSAARDNAVAQARAKASEAAEAAAQRAASEVVQRALGDSVPVTPEGVGEVLRSQVQQGLRGLLGRRGGQSPAAGAGEAVVDSAAEAAADSAAEERGG